MKSKQAKYNKAVKKAIYRRIGKRVGPFEYWLFRRTTTYQHLIGLTPLFVSNTIASLRKQRDSRLVAWQWLADKPFEFPPINVKSSDGLSARMILRSAWSLARPDTVIYIDPLAAIAY